MNTGLITFDDAITSYHKLKNWQLQVFKELSMLMRKKNDPSLSLLSYLENKCRIVGFLDKYEDMVVVSHYKDLIMKDEVLSCLSNKFVVPVKRLDLTLNVYMSISNDSVSYSNFDEFINMIKDNNVNGIKEYNSVAPKFVFEDRCLLQDLVDDKHIDEINRKFGSYKYKIILESKPSTQEERRAVLESKKLSPSASIDLHTKKVQIKSQNKEIEKQINNKYQKICL